MSGAPPLLRLGLPGVWAQVPLHDETRVDRVVELVASSGAAGPAGVAALRAALRQLAGAGGDQLHLRQDPTAPTVLVTAWRPRSGSGPVTAEALRAELGLGPDAVELPRPDDAVLLRSTDASGTTYRVAAPGSAQVLVLAVFLHGAADVDAERAFYEGLAASVTWQDGGARASA